MKTEAKGARRETGQPRRSADLERALFGSTAEKVLRAAPCAVLCVPVE